MKPIEEMEVIGAAALAVKAIVLTRKDGTPVLALQVVTHDERVIELGVAEASDLLQIQEAAGLVLEKINASRETE